MTKISLSRSTCLHSACGLFAFGLLAFLAPPVLPQPTAAEAAFVSNEIIIKLQHNAAALRKGDEIAFDPQGRLHTSLQNLGAYRAVRLFPEWQEEEIGDYVLVRFHDHQPELASSLAQLSRLPEIAQAQFNHVLRTTGRPAAPSQNWAPNDSLFPAQWALATLRATTAWRTTTGAANVLIAVIDTGIELDHPDLQPNLWSNAAEDLNGNGRLDGADVNGSDDDGNGFIDDVIGWDFTDAPNFPDGSDYRDRDNDPSDENGHGTAVSGIIAAVADNRIGIAGLAPGCKVMALRAGTSRGLLEEDDVAAAVVYAVQNGSRVINMSFGDVVVSPLLRDVMQFAHRRGVVLVAAAGNDASAAPNFPAAYSETISVGASDANDRLASFSNYGTTVDLVAPGVDILTTTRQQGYSRFSGTSAAAPFVAALAGLLLARSPDWSNDMIRAALQNTAVDLGAAGWDRFFAAGRIEAAAALAVRQVARAEITSPAMDAGFTGSENLVIRGTVLGAFVERYELSFGAGDDPAAWQPLASVPQRQMLDDSLASWPLAAVPEGVYTLRLVALQQAGPAVEDKVRLTIDRTPPNFSAVQMTPMLDANQPSVLIEFDTDDECRATCWWRPRGSAAAFAALPLNYLTANHRLHFMRALAAGELEFYLEVENRAGLRARNDNGGRYFVLNLAGPEIAAQAFVEIPLPADLRVPAGLLLPRAADFDQDGRPELLLSVYGENNTIGPLTIFEWNGQGFAPQYTSNWPLIPRDVGDSNGDGKLELLAGMGPRSFIFEAPQINAFPTQLVWADSGEFWASRFADVDGDGRSEIIARDEAGFAVWEAIADHTFQAVALLENFTAGENGVGVPHAELGDFDGDGRQEILLGDSDGDLYIYEAGGDNNFVAAWHDRMPLLDTIDFIRAGDFDGDGRADFAAGCHSTPALNSEHEFDARHWLFRVYRSAGDNQFEVIWEQRFFGFQPPPDFDAGVGAGDSDGDGRDELFLNLFPDGYVVDFDAGSGRVIWHYQPARSNTTIVTALSPGAGRSFHFSDGEVVRLFAPAGSETAAPSPFGISARPRDASSVFLHWQPVEGAEGYLLSRGQAGGADDFNTSVSTNEYLDAGLISEQAYHYTIATIDSQRQQIIGPPSRSVSARPTAAPRVVRAAFFPPQQVAVTFSETMHEDLRWHGRFCLRPVASSSEAHGCHAPASIVSSRAGREVILSFDEYHFAAGEYEIEVANVFDVDFAPLDSAHARARFQVAATATRFYLTSARLESPKSLLLAFNLPVDPVSATAPANYRLRIQNESGLQPALHSATVLAENPAAVRLLLRDGFIAPTGLNYLITVQSVRSAEGIPLRPGEGDALGFAPAAANLDEVKVFPNPFVASRHHRLMIAGLTPAATIKILDLQGRVLVTLRETDGNGGYAWDGRDQERKLLPSGVYVCYVNSGTQTAWAKFVIVR